MEMLKCHPPWYEFEPTAAMFKIVTDDTHPNLPPHCSEHAEHFLSLCFMKYVIQSKLLKMFLFMKFLVMETVFMFVEMHLHIALM